VGSPPCRLRVETVISGIGALWNGPIMNGVERRKNSGSPEGGGNRKRPMNRKAAFVIKNHNICHRQTKISLAENWKSR